MNDYNLAVQIGWVFIMKRLEFRVALQQFDAESRIGTYKINDHKSDMYEWHNCVFYFDGIDKVIVIGNIPIELGYHLFLNFVGDPTISFENDNRGQWFKENITFDPNISEKEKTDIMSKKLHRIYTISSLRTLLAFLVFIDRYESNKDMLEEVVDYDDKDRRERQLENYAKLNDLIEQYYMSVHTCEEVLTGLRIPDIASAPCIPETYTLPKVTTNLESEILKSTLDTFDTMANPFQFYTHARDNYLEALNNVDIEIDYNADKSKRKLKMGNRSSSTRVSYECSRMHIAYSGIVQTDDIQYVRINHIYSRYLPDIHMTGEIVELILSCSPQAKEFTKRSIRYNLTENRIFKDGKWYAATPEDVAEFTRTIEFISGNIRNEITSHLLSNKNIKFQRVTEKKE